MSDEIKGMYMIDALARRLLEHRNNDSLLFDLLFRLHGRSTLRQYTPVSDSWNYQYIRICVARNETTHKSKPRSA